MQDRATYSGGYSLIFAAVALVVGATAVVRRDGLVTMAAVIFGLYILHLLSLRSLARSQARTVTRPSRAPQAQPQVGATRTSSRARRNAEIQPSLAGGKPEGIDGPVFLSPKSGFVKEVGESSRPSQQQPATDDSKWMVEARQTDEEPEFLPADTDGPMQAVGTGRASSPDVAIPRKFALGTVAIIQRALDPAQVARILEEQRKFPKKRFGEIAVELEYITDPQLDELLAAQKAGLFKEADIQAARARLEAFRREASSAVA